MKRIAYVFISCIFALLAVFAVKLFYVLSEDPCGSDILKRFPDPSGSQSIIITLYNCGATTAYSLGARFENDGPRINYDNDFFRIRGEGGIEVEWKKEAGGSTFVPIIKYNPDLIYRQASIWDQARIYYSPK